MRFPSRPVVGANAVLTRRCDADYNHYSALTTVEENWDLGSLGEGDVNADVYEFLAKGLDHENTNEEPLVTGLGPGIEPGSATL